MSKKRAQPESAESIIARHEQIRRIRTRFANQARDAKRRHAAARGIPIPRWEAYWRELDEWKNLMIEQEIDKELHANGHAPTPPTTPIPPPHKPDNLEKVGGNSRG